MLKYSRVSNYVNCWKVIFNGKLYAIMPAHCAIFKDNNNEWKRSNLLSYCDSSLKWYTTKKWLINKNPENDFAWANINLSVENLYCSLKPKNTKNCCPVDVGFYFNQPYDYKGNLQKLATLGKVNGTIYESPNSGLLEVINIGFNGMSGAIAISNEKTLEMVGMFIGRGKNLGSDWRQTSRGMIITSELMLENIKDNNIEEI